MVKNQFFGYNLKIMAQNIYAYFTQNQSEFGCVDAAVKSAIAFFKEMIWERTQQSSLLPPLTVKWMKN